MKKALKVIGGIALALLGGGFAASQLVKKDQVEAEVFVDDADYSTDEVYATDMDGETEE